MQSSVSPAAKMPAASKQVPLPWRLGTPGRPLLIAHRAGCGEAPENTIAAMKHSEKAGAHGMQMDILPSADGVPLIVHDKDLYLLTGKQVDVTQLAAKDVPPLLSELKPATIGGPAVTLRTADFGPAGTRIGTLADLLAQVGPNTHLILETWKDDDKLIQQTAVMIQAAGMNGRVTLGNPFSASICQKCSDSIPDVQTIMELWEAQKLAAAYAFGLLGLCKVAPNKVFNIPLVTDTAAWFEGLARVDPRGVKKAWGELLVFRVMLPVWKWLYTRPGLFQALQARGVPVVAFILNDESSWQVAAKLGANAVQTDFPKAYAAWQKRL